MTSSSNNDYQLTKGIKKGVWPNLQPHTFRVTSLASRQYNCIAWAAGVADRPWAPNTSQHYWPHTAPPDFDLQSYMAAFTIIGYEPCQSGDLEDNVEKIAFYIDAENYVTHISRQLPNGKWTSKMGAEWEDIEHESPQVLEGDPQLAIDDKSYGQVGQYMKRERVGPLPIPPSPVS